jgi:GT2 family glycosyltransferase
VPATLEFISVVIVNWNRRELLRACLNSLCRQQGPKFEVILVDNGSTDGSLEMAAGEFSEPLSLTCVANRENRGFCAANNQGIAAARGEFIALLNNDAEAEPGWLEALLRVFDGRPHLGMAASKIVSYHDPSVIDKAGHLIFLDGQNRGRGTGQQDRGQFDKVEEVIWPDGCAAMYRRAMLDQIGGFDEDLFAYGDDAELGLRARIAGWDCLYVPRAVVRHHHSSTLGAQSFRRIELIERNRVLLAVKLFPWSLLWLNGAFYLVRLAAGGWATLRNRGEAARFPGWTSKLRVVITMLKADLQALMLLPKMLRKRSQIRRFRQLTPSQLRSLLLRHRISLRELTEQAI